MEKLDFDHGWGRFPRELFKYQAKLKLNQYESQVLRGIGFFVIGFSKREETISVSQLVEMTGIDKRNVNNTVNSLIKKKAIEVKENRYRLLFTDDIKVIHTDDHKKIKVMWSGTEYIHTDDRSHPHRSESHPQRRTPKTLSKDSLRLSPKKKEIFTKLSEEELEKNRARALAIAEKLKKKFGEA
ncbi:hypothetical protein ES705_29210 [subsurface metagenome]